MPRTSSFPDLLPSLGRACGTRRALASTVGVSRVEQWLSLGGADQKVAGEGRARMADADDIEALITA